MDHKRRLTGLQEEMSRLNIDLVIYGSCQNFQYLTGLPLEWRRRIDLLNSVDNIFVPQIGQPVLTLSDSSFRYADETWVKDIRVTETGKSYSRLLEGIASDLEEITRIALGDHLWGSTVLDIINVFKGAEICQGESFMDRLRMIKENGEIALLRKAAELTENVMQEIVSGIREDITQRELGLRTEMLGRRKGASDVSFPATAGFVKSGSEVSDTPFIYPRDEGLVSGTSIAFDVGFVLEGYCSDWGRSFYWGPANQEVRKGYEALQQAMVETVDQMYDGSMKISEVFSCIEKALDRLGYGDFLRARHKTRSVGHQIGVEVHEPPWLRPENEEQLQSGMVMCLEPKLWHAGQYYLRVEDMVLVKSNEAEFLTNFDRELFQL